MQPDQVDIPHDLPTLRRNITEWLSQSVKHMNQSDSAGMVHCWKKLLAAWEPASAVEAGQLLTAGTLFKDKSEAGFEAPTEGAEADEPADTAEGAAEWATAEPEEDEYTQYFDWDRFEAEQGDEEAAEQGGAAGGEQGGERGVKSVSEYSRLRCLVLR